MSHRERLERIRLVKDLPREALDPQGPRWANWPLYIDVTEHGCWIWTGGLEKHGYASISMGSQKCLGHNLMFEAFIRKPKRGLHRDHTCSRREGADPLFQRRCINPWHLKECAPRTNTRLAVRPKRENCPGTNPLGEVHDYADPENVYIDTRGFTNCRPCHRIRNRLWMQGWRAAQKETVHAVL